MTSSALGNALRSMSPDEVDQVRQISAHYAKEWKKIKRLHGPSVAFSVHAGIDKRIEILLATAPRAGEVKCRPGCAACCSVHIDVTPQEAQLLALHATAKGIEIDRDRMARQAENDSVEAWRDLSPAEKRCIFLTADNTCSVYEHRPNACRKYLVVTDPEYCDIDKYPAATVSNLVDLEAELMHVAALKVFKWGGLPRMVRAALAKIKGEKHGS